jgi:hypothetical protein
MTNIILCFEWSSLPIPFLLLCFLLDHSHPYTLSSKCENESEKEILDRSIYRFIVLSSFLTSCTSLRRQNKLTKHSLGTKRQTSTIETSCEIEELFGHASIDLRRIKKEWMTRRFFLSMVISHGYILFVCSHALDWLAYSFFFSIRELIVLSEV